MNIEERAPVAIITGASSGIGKAAARALAARGWRVIGLGRDPKRCAAAKADISAAALPGRPVDMILADLSLMRDAARAAGEVAALTGQIDALINNAGGVASKRVVTPEGNEATFAGNHLGHFLLTNRVLPFLRAAAVKPGGARIIAVSSSGHEVCPGLDWNDLQRLDNFTPGGAYTSAKLANILFTRALAARSRGRRRLVSRKGPRWLPANVASLPSAVTTRLLATPPALLISTSTWPVRAATSCAARAASVISDRSASTMSTGRPEEAADIASFAAAQRPGSRPKAMMRQPAAASAHAAALPIPELAPVTTAVGVRPLMFMVGPPGRYTYDQHGC